MSEVEEWDPERKADELDEKRREIQAIKGSLSNRGALITYKGKEHFVCFDCSGTFRANWKNYHVRIEKLATGRKIVRPLCRSCDAIRLAEGVST